MGSRELSRGILLLSLLVAVLASDLRGQSHVEEGRSLEEGQNETKPSRTLVRTARVDPLHGFKKYRGGYNITDKHYWSSTIFTGIYGYSIALIWLLGGLVYASILLITALCCINKRKKKSKVHPCSRRCCLWPKPTAVLFTLLAIVASAVVLAGSSRFNSRANSVKNIIKETAEQASDTIYNVTKLVEAMQNNDELPADLEGSTNLMAASQKLNDEASNIQRKAEKNVRIISKGLKILDVTSIVIVSLNLVSVLALLGSGFLKLQWPFRMFIVLSWILTFQCWAHFGLYFFLDRFAGDTCTALDEFQQDPRNSSLSEILPCNDQLSAMSVLRDTREGIHDLIDQVLKRYKCSSRDGGACGDGEFISANDYNRVLVYTTSLQNLLNSFPGVERLVNCQLVKDAFSDILSRQCRPLKRYAHMAWAAMAALSTTMVLLVLTWAVVARHDSKHHSSDVNPRSTEYRNTTDLDTNNMVLDHKGPPLEP